MPVTLIAFETERETESESSKFYEVDFDPKFLRRGGMYRPMRTILHFYIDAICVVVFLRLCL